jgi:hypothetical protein
MVISVLEANVPTDKWEELKISFRNATRLLLPQMKETLLVQSTIEPLYWKIVTVWHSTQQIHRIQETIQQSGVVEIFRMIGIEPRQGLFEVIMNARESDLGSDLAETPVSDVMVPVEDFV